MYPHPSRQKVLPQVLLSFLLLQELLLSLLSLWWSGELDPCQKVMEVWTLGFLTWKGTVGFRWGCGAGMAEFS